MGGGGGRSWDVDRRDHNSQLAKQQTATALKQSIKWQQSYNVYPSPISQGHSQWRCIWRDLRVFWDNQHRVVVFRGPQIPAVHVPLWSPLHLAHIDRRRLPFRLNSYGHPHVVSDKITRYRYDMTVYKNYGRNMAPFSKAFPASRKSKFIRTLLTLITFTFYFL